MGETLNDPRIFAPATTQTNSDGDQFESRWAPHVVPVVSEPVVKGGQGHPDMEVGLTSEPAMHVEWSQLGLALACCMVWVAAVAVVAWAIARHWHH